VLVLLNLISLSLINDYIVAKRKLPRQHVSPMLLFSRLAWPRRAAQTMISYKWCRSPKDGVEPSAAEPGHTDLALLLANLLPQVWLDRFQLQVGDEIGEQTAAAAVHSRLLVCLISPEYLQSPACCHELREAALHRGAARPTVLLMQPNVCSGAGLIGGADERSKSGSASPAPVSDWRAVREALATLPGFVIVESVSELLAWIHAHHLANAPSAAELRAALSWWQTFGVPLRLSTGLVEEVDEEEGEEGVSGGGGGNGGGAGAMHGTLTAPAMHAQRWPLADLLTSWPYAAAVLLGTAAPRSAGKIFAGFAYLEDDGQALRTDYRPHTLMRFTVAGLLPPLVSVAFSVVILVSLVSGAVPQGSKTVIALVSVLVCWVSAALTVRGLAPFFRIGANLIAHPSLLPLCLAACLQAGNDGSAAAASASTAVATASVRPTALFGGTSAGAHASEGAAETEVVVTHPKHVLGHGSHQPAAPRLRIVLVHEAEPPEGSSPAALEMERVRAMLRAPGKDWDGKDKESCDTFDKARLRALLDNTAAFVLQHLGLSCESRVLDAVLGAPGEPLRSAAPMTVYVFFVWTPAGMKRRAETCHLDSWPAAQCATVTPPFSAVQRDAPQLLSALNVLAGAKCGVGKDSPYPGIVPAIFAAVAAKAGAVLLNTSA